MKKLYLFFVLLIIAAILFVAKCAAQEQPTITQSIFNGQTTARPSGGLCTTGGGVNPCTGGFLLYIPDIGQCTHTITIRTANVTAIQVEFENTDNPSVTIPQWQQISTIFTSPSGGTLSTSGSWYKFVRVNILSMTGTGAAVSVTYFGTQQCAGPAGGITGGAINSQPVTFVSAIGSTSNTVTSAAPMVFTQTGGTNVIFFGGTATNLTASPVFVVISAFSGGGIGSTSQYVKEVPANSSVDLMFPTIGYVATNPSGTIKLYCTTSITTPADPGTACQITAMYKFGVLVNGNVTTNGAQQGNQQPANPTP